jgi:hypothetical protein
MTAPVDQDVRDRITSETEQPLFVEAGAGSGKTKLLVERIVALVREGRPMRQIAAVTFTEKAAAELRDRLRDALGKEDLRDALDELDGAVIGGWLLDGAARGARQWGRLSAPGQPRRLARRGPAAGSRRTDRSPAPGADWGSEVTGAIPFTGFDPTTNFDPVTNTVAEAFDAYTHPRSALPAHGSSAQHGLAHLSEACPQWRYR